VARVLTRNFSNCAADTVASTTFRQQAVRHHNIDLALAERGRCAVLPFYICLNRGRIFGSAASSAFQRTIRAPCDSKNARSSGVKKEEPSARLLNSKRSRPSDFRSPVRTSLMKNFQSASVHSNHSPSSRRAIR